jgi:hypothetical protein
MLIFLAGRHMLVLGGGDPPPPLAPPVALQPYPDRTYTVSLNWDPDNANAGYVFSNSDRTITQSASSNFTRFVVTTDAVEVSAIRGVDKVYWELGIDGSSGSNFNGYVGIMEEERGRADADIGQNPIFGASAGWRGIGEVRGNGNTDLVSGVPIYGSGDVLMLAFDIKTRELWLGKNGTWHDDPAVDPATFTLDEYVAERFVLTAQTRGLNEIITLRTLTSQFSYTAPTGFTEAGALLSDGFVFMELSDVDLYKDALLAGAALNNADVWLGLTGAGTSIIAADVWLEIELAEEP